MKCVGFVAMLIVAALACGCGDYPLSPRERHALTQAMARWEREGGQGYTVEARIACFCPPHLAQWTRLTVHNGVVVAADPLESLPGGIEPDLSGWLTVDEEFRRLSDPPDILREIEVRYDPELGYPTFIRADCGPNVADCGSVHEMRNLQLPAGLLIRSRE
jgi:hypothetical protein